MEVVSNDFRPTIYSGEANHIAILTIGETTIPNENIKSIRLSNPIIDKTNDTFYIGTFISKQLEIEFYNADSIDLSGQIHLAIGTYIESLGDYETLNIGYFNIETSPEDYYKNAKIVALDNAVKFKPNVDYSSAMTPSSLNPETNTITCEELLIWMCNYFGVTLGTYPNINKDIEISTYDSSVSGKQYISYIAEIMGGNAQIGRDGHLYIIPFKQTPSVQINATLGKSWELGDKYEITGVTYFDAIRDIPFTSGDDTHNTLYIRSDNPFVVGDNEQSSEIIQNIYNELVGTTLYNIKCENYADYSLDSWDFIEYLLETYVLTQDSTFVVDKTYYEQLENEFVEYEGELVGDPSALGLYETTLVSYPTINNNEFTYEMTIMGKVAVEIPNKQVEKTTNTVEGNETTKFNILKTIIDQEQNEIRIIAGQSNDLQSQVNTLTASQQGLVNSLVIAGGTNLIRNSALFFTNQGNDYSLTEDTEFQEDKVYYEYVNYEYVEYSGTTTGSPAELGLYEEQGTRTIYEYWKGNLERDRADNSQVLSESGTVILTKRLGAIQNISVLPDSYTLSFKYKKLSHLSKLTFQVDGETIIEKEYVLTQDTQFIVGKTYYVYLEGEYTEYTDERTGDPRELELYELVVYDGIVSEEGTIEKSISNSDGIIDISFASSIDNGYCIYDLMLNKGNLPLEYTQNINETITDTVKIGKGISVESTSTETITRVDSDGFRVLNKNTEEVVLKATDTGTDTKTLTVHSWAEISGLRIQNTDNQTWITGII